MESDLLSEIIGESRLQETGKSCNSLAFIGKYKIFVHLFLFYSCLQKRPGKVANFIENEQEFRCDGMK